MKYLILISTFLIIGTFVNAQPTGIILDAKAGSSIEFDDIYNKKTCLIIKDWLPNQKYHPNCELYILSNKAKNMENPFNHFFIFKSEMDSSYKYLYLVYGDKLMTIKIRKNEWGISIHLKRLNFKEGSYLIDLKELYRKYKNANIELDEFEPLLDADQQ